MVLRIDYVYCKNIPSENYMHFQKKSEDKMKELTWLLVLPILNYTFFGLSSAFETTVSDRKRNEEGNVLTQQHVTYSDAPVNTDYRSDSQFKPRGMQHVYTITHAFLDLVQRKDVLPGSINATQVLDDDFWAASGDVKAKQIYKVIHCFKAPNQISYNAGYCIITIYG